MANSIALNWGQANIHEDAESGTMRELREAQSGFKVRSSKWRP